MAMRPEFQDMHAGVLEGASVTRPEAVAVLNDKTPFPTAIYYYAFQVHSSRACVPSLEGWKSRSVSTFAYMIKVTTATTTWLLMSLNITFPPNITFPSGVQ